VTAFSADTIATVVVFTSLGLVALALVLLVRRYSASAFVIGLVGLLALTTSATWFASAESGVDPQVLDSLKTELATEKKGLQKSRERIREIEKRETDQIARALAAEAQRNKAQREAERERAKAKAMKTALLAEEAEHAKSISKVAELENKLLGTTPQQLPLSQMPGSPQEPGSPNKPGILSRKFANSFGTPFYTLQPLERSLISGLTGSWYVVRLKIGGNPIDFADGKFRMPEAVQQVQDSALQLQKDVLIPIKQAAKSTRLFLRGGADSRRLLGSTERPDARVREPGILRRLPDGTYEADARCLPKAAHIRNVDLPNLRADWLRQQIRHAVPALGSANIDIMENPPSPDHDRTVDLILYVEW
jgi:hypothetical protein